MWNFSFLQSFAERESFSKSLVELHIDFSHYQFSMEKTNKSLLWDYFEKLPNGEGKCKTCKREIACTSGNTIGLGRHLLSHHVKLNKVLIYRVTFLTGPALKVLSAEDGKIPTKKVKVWVKTSYFICKIPLLSLFW